MKINIFKPRLTNKHILAFLIFLVYFLFGLFTLKNYNISWDEPTHFKRGQAYLAYFLTGEKTYEKLPEYDLVEARNNLNYHERSLYQEDGFDAAYHFEKDGDHPPLNDILAALTNYVFYQKLGIMDDVESYHLFEILISAVLVSAIFIFAYEAFGLWTGVFSALFLATYPLFWGESHFNIKDPIETAFFSISIYFIWKSVVRKNAKLLLTAAIFVGLGLATKLNIVFLPLIIAPWFFYLILRNKALREFVFSKKYIFFFSLIPLIAYGIFVVSWPWLWSNIIGNTLRVLNYYHEIGTEVGFSPVNALKGWSFYAIKWVFYTTPPLLILLSVLTVILWRNIKDKGYTLILLFLWFFITVLRVTFPGTSIYGGVRQIMEYIPALSMIAAVSAGFIFERLKNSLLKYLFLIVVSIILIYPLWKLHPNENVYFNGFIGGVSGAIDKGFPSAGFSFGNAYLQGLNWINENVEDGGRLALVQGTVLNIPAYKIRPDIDYSNAHWSGIERHGEYLIDLTYNYELKVFHYAWEYVEKILDPVYEVKVGGASILKVWKNDFDHTKPEYKKNEVLYLGSKKVIQENNIVAINLPQDTLLSKLVVNFDPREGCDYKALGYIETSRDGVNWTKEKDVTGEEQISGIKGMDKTKLTFFFAGRVAKSIRIPAFNKNSCILNNPNISIYILE